MEVIVLERTGSTNSFLQDMLGSREVAEGTIVLSNEQTEGRGQRGKAWLSLPGEGLYASMLLKPDWCPAGQQFIINKAIACAVAEFAEEKTNNRAYVKWPNDIICSDRKIAGILIESSLRGTTISSMIVGVGVNLNQEYFGLNFETPAVSFRILTGKSYDFRTEGGILFSKLWSYYEKVKSGYHSWVNDEYRRRLYKLNTPALYSMGDQYFKGVMKDVDKDGRILIDVGNEIGAFHHPEVRMVMKAQAEG